MSEYVYESPDGGDTVYRRKVGSSNKELHSVSDQHLEVVLRMKQRQEWVGIRERARTDPALQEMVDQLTVYYRLKYEK